MKKAVALIMAIVFALSVPLCCFADMDGPTNFEYESYIIAQNGAQMYDSIYFDDEGVWKFVELDEILDFGTVVIVGGTFEKDGETYASCYIDYGDDKKEIFCVKQVDLNSELPEIDFRQMTKLAFENKVTVINPDGIVLRSGPHENYPVCSKVIPYGTDLICTYENSKYNANWSYTTYNGESGWFESFQFNYNYNCAEKLDDNCILDGTMTVYGNETKMYSNLKDLDSKGKEILTVPVGTKLTFDTYYPIPHGFAIKTKYNGKTGWIKDCSYIPYTDESEVNLYGLKGKGFSLKKGEYKLYSEAKNFDNYTTITIPENAFFDYTGCLVYGIGDDSDFVKYYWYRINYNGKSGWLAEQHASDGEEEKYLSDSLLFSEIEMLKTGKSALKMRKLPDEKSETICTIPASSVVMQEFYSYDLNMAYVLYNGKGGWIKSFNNDKSVFDELDNISLSTNNYGIRWFSPDKFDFSVLDTNTSSKSKGGAEKAEKGTATDTGTNNGESTVKAKADVEQTGKGTVADTSANNGETKPAVKPVNLSPSRIALYCGIGAAALALAAAVTIVLINKKKKNK